MGDDVQLFRSLTADFKTGETRRKFQNVFLRRRRCVRVPLQEISAAKSSGCGLNAKTDGGELAYAQTTPPPALTSAPGTLRCTKFPSEVTLPHLHLRRKVIEMGLVSEHVKWEVNE